MGKLSEIADKLQDSETKQTEPSKTVSVLSGIAERHSAREEIGDLVDAFKIVAQEREKMKGK